jgi:predicted amidohydrolase YtcJ
LQWQASVELVLQNQLTLAVEQYFNVSQAADFTRGVDLCLEALRQTRDDPRLSQLRPQGIKIFSDGALGSEGALLSQPYNLTTCCQKDGAEKKYGLALLSNPEIQEMMELTWSKGLDLAVHSIGDESADRVARAALRAWKKFSEGRLHIEHAQVLRPETIELLRQKNVECHMQPCHWLSDRVWLKEKLGPLHRFSFPWQALELAGIYFDFGSDSPIERPSIFDTALALEKSSLEDIPAMNDDWKPRHVHRDLSWTAETYTEIDHQQVLRTIFKGQKIFG